jgi:sugar O-acyltransferase (sialic acid O-acetyltransferase NeuD family)
VKIVIYGNGAIAKVVFSYINKKTEVAAFTVDDACIASGVNSFCGMPLIPFNSVQKVFDPQKYSIIIAIGFMEMNELRSLKYEEAQHKGYSLATFIHESVIIHDEVFIEEGCIILDHVSIHPGSRILRGTFISSNVNIGHDCMIESFNWINSGVSIAGGCYIGSGCFFGVNSSVAHNLKIGKQNFIAANTLVNKNTRDGDVYISEAGQLFQLSSKSFLKFARIFD